MSDFYGILMTICFVTCYIPQIIKMIKTRKSEDVSLLSYLIILIGTAFSALYSISLGKTAVYLLIQNILCVGLILITITLWFRYKIKK